MAKIISYEVQVVRGASWDKVSQHVDKSAALAAAARRSAAAPKTPVRVVEHSYDPETRISDTLILPPTASAPATPKKAESSPSPAPPPAGKKKRGGQSINRILITLIVLAVGVFALVAGVSYLFQRGYLG